MIGKMSRKIVVAIEKGGTAKTKTAIELAAALHKQGSRVLLIDLDPQADATKSLGFNPGDLAFNINQLFTRRDVEPEQVVLTTSWGIDLLPSHRDLRTTEAGMKHTQVGLLRSILVPLEPRYDHIVIDTPHSGAYLPILALAVATDVVIPMQPHYEAFEKIPELLLQVEQIRLGLNPDIRVDGILPVLVHPRNSVDRAILDQVKETYPNLLYPMRVDWSTKYAQATLSAEPIVVSEPSHPGSEAYMKLAERFR